MDNILNSIKQMLGIHKDIDSFDDVLISHINSVFVILSELGVGKTLFIIEKESTWNDLKTLLDTTNEKMALLKTYIFMKVKKIFDPPSNSSMQSYDNLISEYEYRINHEFDITKEV